MSADPVARLFEPISPEAPSGASIRFDAVYEKIREARREDDPSIPRGVWERALKVADFGATVELCTGVLETRSKDLQVAAWLADAWGQLQGVAGVTRGIQLVAGLCERFWPTIFPEIDEDGDEARCGVLAWLDGALASRLRAVSLDGERGSFTIVDWERAGTPPPPDATEPPLTREGFIARLSLVGVARWVALSDEVAHARRAASALDASLAANMSDPPSLRRLDAAIARLEEICEELVKASGGRPVPAKSVRAPANGAHHAASSSSGPIASRADAYQKLAQAAEYLLRTEPHSPVPYLVQRAISWGNLSLAELLQEFITGADDLVVTHRLLGMRRRDE